MKRSEQEVQHPHNRRSRKREQDNSEEKINQHLTLENISETGVSRLKRSTEYPVQ